MPYDPQIDACSLECAQGVPPHRPKAQEGSPPTRLGRSADKPGSVPAGKSLAEGGDFKSVEQGAATSVWCAASPQLAEMGGVYRQDVVSAPVLPSDSSSNVGVRDYAIDPVAAERLWKLSEDLTGVTI